MAKQNNLKIYTALTNSLGMQDRLPKIAQQNLKDIAKSIFTGAEYKADLNNFLVTLIDKVGLTLFRENKIKNEFSDFVYYGMTFGEVIEEIFVNPAIAEDYQPTVIVNNTSIDPHRITTPDVKALYIKNEVKRKYRVTRFESQLKKAFYSEYGFYNMLENLSLSLIKGATLDERYMFKEILNNCITTDEAKFKISKFPKMYVNNTINRVMDKDTAINFITDVKNKISDMLLPNGDFNSQGCINQNTTDDLIVFLRKDIATTLQTEVFASAFNSKELSFTPAGYEGQKIRVILVEDFGGSEPWKADGSKKLNIKYDTFGKFMYYYDTDENVPYTQDVKYYNNYMDKQPNQKAKYDVACVIADKRLPIIAIEKDEMYTTFNGEGIYTNTVLHRWAHYGFSGFADYCVFFEKHKENI